MYLSSFVYIIQIMSLLMLICGCVYLADLMAFSKSFSRLNKFWNFYDK